MAGYKRIYKNIKYLKKEHFCPDCGAKLETVEVSKVVNSRSPEAKDFDFSFCGNYMLGTCALYGMSLNVPIASAALQSTMKSVEGVPEKDKFHWLGQRLCGCLRR
ncbi:MAG: hypothetical protein V8S82_02670 [Eubacteriales bacterium]